MEKIISSNQGIFLEERQIAKNTIIAHKIGHKIKKHKGKNGLMVVKIDLKKAYDRVT